MTRFRNFFKILHFPRGNVYNFDVAYNTSFFSTITFPKSFLWSEHRQLRLEAGHSSTLLSTCMFSGDNMHNFHTHTKKKKKQQHQQQQNPTWSIIAVPAHFLREQTASSQTHGRQVRTTWLCGVVPKGFSAFLGSLYKEVAKTASGALV